MSPVATVGTVTTYSTTTDPADQYRVEKPADYDVDEVVYFVEVLGTYDLGGTTFPFYYTSMPRTPPASLRKIDASLSRMAGYIPLNKRIDPAWLRPRLRTIGALGPGSGDTCCSLPGEVVTATLPDT